MFSAAGRKVREYTEEKGMLKIEHYSKKYRNSEKYSAEDICLQVSAGEVCGLVGSNGAGKSTILKAVTGILPFEEGTIELEGYDIARRPEEAKRLIGYVPDDHTVYEKLTGREYVNYIGSLYGAGKAQKERALGELAEKFGIEQALDVQIANYSHGMKQKICILGALVHEPMLWVLDEPMVGLDPQTMLLLRGFIRQYADEGHIVLFSSHNLDAVQKACDKVAFIRGGRLISLTDLREDKDFDLEAYYLRVIGEQADA